MSSYHLICYLCLFLVVIEFINKNVDTTLSQKLEITMCQLFKLMPIR